MSIVESHVSCAFDRLHMAWLNSIIQDVKQSVSTSEYLVDTALIEKLRMQDVEDQATC